MTSPVVIHPHPYRRDVSSTYAGFGMAAGDTPTKERVA